MLRLNYTTMHERPKLLGKNVDFQEVITTSISSTICIREEASRVFAYDAFLRQSTVQHVAAEVCIHASVTG